jgi:succinate dehydrogenase / fumarate reductase membrane anchor subunit
LNYRSPLHRARGWGSSGHGSSHWKFQRLSAIALGPLGLWFVFAFAGQSPWEYQSIISWLSNPWVPQLLCLFLACGFFHASLGLQVVIEDYVHDEFIRNASLIVVKLTLLLLAVSSIISVLIAAL